MRIFCSICKELFTLFAEVCITKCGHLYHENCLKLWQERSPSCPQCRTKIKGNPGRVFFNTEDAQLDSQADVDSLQTRIDSLLETTAELKVQNKELESSNASLKESIAKYEEKAKMNRETILVLQGRVNALNKEKEDLLPLKVMNERLKNKLKHKTELDALLKGTENEVREMLSKTPVTSLAVHQLCVYVEALKHQLRKYEEKYKYKSEAVAHMQKHQASLKQTKTVKTNINLKANKITNTSGKMYSDSEEENEVREAFGKQLLGKNPKRPSTSSSEFKPELKEGVTSSSNILKSNQNKVSEDVSGKTVRKVLNNLGKPVKRDSSDADVQVHSGQAKIKMFKSASTENCGIFDKSKVSEGSENGDRDAHFDAWKLGLSTWRKMRRMHGRSEYS